MKLNMWNFKNIKLCQLCSIVTLSSVTNIIWSIVSSAKIDSFSLSMSVSIRISYSCNFWLKVSSSEASYRYLIGVEPEFMLVRTLSNHNW